VCELSGALGPVVERSRRFEVGGWDVAAVQPVWLNQVHPSSGSLPRSPGHGGCGDHAAVAAVVGRASSSAGASMPILVCRRRGNE